MKTNENAFNKVTAFLKANPTLSITEALQKTEVSAATYYKARKDLKTKGESVRRKYTPRKINSITIEAAPIEMSSKRIVVLMGEPETIARMLGL